MDPWPPKPKPSRSGPGPLAPQAGPAQDPWPPEPNPSRSGPGPLALLTFTSQIQQFLTFVYAVGGGGAGERSITHTPWPSYFTL